MICSSIENEITRHDRRGGGSLEDTSPFIRRVAGSNPALAATLGKSFTRNCLWHFGMKLRSCLSVDEHLFRLGGIEA